MEDCQFSPAANIGVQDKGSGVRCNESPCDDNRGEIFPCVETEETDEGSNQDTGVVEPPKVGMIFTSWKAVEAYYKQYTEQQGFGVSRVQGVLSKKEGRRERISITWRCECYGRPDMRAQREAKKRAKEMGMSGSGGVVGGVVVEDELSRSKRRSKKCECKAKVYASVDRAGKWVIKRVELEHSGHTPKPEDSKLVKEYRMKGLTPNVKRTLIHYYDVGVPVSQILGCLGSEVCGSSGVSYTVKDLEHEVYKSKRLKMIGSDSCAMMSYLQQMQAGTQNFFHAVRLDDDGRLKDVIWADGRSRAAYEEFGDVVCFDATYSTNVYDFPFLNFVGVNHHGQSILLGCALVTNEDCDTYNLVFKQWLECMNDVAPKAILTDQAAAMRRSLEEVMPNTRHRWCIWHIMRKIPEKLGKCDRYQEFKSKLKATVYESCTIQEFETRWCALVDMYKLGKNDWLISLYKEHHMWVPTFMKQYFWAGMKTTQRVESINSFFDGFVNRHTKLYEFPNKYAKAMLKRVRDEVEADAKCSKYIRRVVTGFAVEKLFQILYTDTKFQEVQTECSRIMYCYPREENKISDTLMQYVLEDRVWVVPEGRSEEVLTNRRRLYSATYNLDTKVVCCDCSKFETSGIMCRHTIRILDLNNVVDIPERYILNRWLKDIMRKHTHVKVSYHDPSKTVKVKRHNKLMGVFGPICEEAAMVDDSTVELVLNRLESLKTVVRKCSKRKLDQTVPRCSPDEGAEIIDLSSDFPQTHSGLIESSSGPAVKDPLPKKKGRGRPKGSRNKGLAEVGYKKQTSKKRTSNKSSEEPVPTKRCRGRPKKSSKKASDEVVNLSRTSKKRTAPVRKPQEATETT
ncbi:protein FAR1-RELATED SEQUENCE 6-like [Chenopodium quinoa]|uniref:protein FAR1-RELATED SEQUENCE 6-like n=1 Tax=Chenopodium quinoa TaxID=63459 RepID=UPI000B797C59|nr:protein FAR1-RELATED SEQUENCE 6-like [Chenopodium quinoa]